MGFKDATGDEASLTLDTAIRLLSCNVRAYSAVSMFNTVRQEVRAGRRL